MTVEARVCPRCSSPMVLRTAKRGTYEGQQFWGCSSYPRCRAVIGQADQPDVVPGHADVPEPVAGASAQAEFERRQAVHAERIRATWPAAVGITVVVMLVAYLLVQAFLGPAWGAGAAAGVALIFLVAYLERPQTLEAWRIGAAGERKTGRHLAGLEEYGFVVLHDRKVPGYGGNLDHVVIGPTGVWAVETKSLRGKVDIRGDSLRIGGRSQDRIIDQVYRQATSIQIALETEPGSVGILVTPVICLHRGELPFFTKTVRGVRLASGRQLVRLLRDGERRLSEEDVQRIASVAARLLRVTRQ